MNVYFGRNFWYDIGKSEEQGQPGIGIKSGEGFWYGDFWWLVPAVYVCREGIVLDICRQVPRERVKGFFDKWGEWEGREDEMTERQMLQVQQENPFHFEVDFRLEMDGSVFNGSSGSSICIEPDWIGKEAGAHDCGAEMSTKAAEAENLSKGKDAEKPENWGKAKDTEKPENLGKAEDMEKSENSGKAKVSEEPEKNGRPAGRTLEERIALEYGLDRNDGWQVFRYSFRCEEEDALLRNGKSDMVTAGYRNNEGITVMDKDKNDVRGTVATEDGIDACNWVRRELPLKLRLRVSAREIMIPCECFFVTEKNCDEHVQRFLHPVTGQQMELTILKCREYDLDIGESALQGHMKGYRLPSHACTVEYVVKPEPIPGEYIVIRDCCQGDRPVSVSSYWDHEKAAVAVSIIGGADGPVSVFLAGKVREKEMAEALRVVRYGYSSLYFDPVRQFRWQVELRKTPFAAETFDLKVEDGNASYGWSL